MIDELDSLLPEEIASMDEEPPISADLLQRADELQARADEVGCSEAEMQELLRARADDLEVEDIFGALFLSELTSTDRSVNEIVVGDCFNLPEETEFYEVDPIDCAELHEVEVFSLLDLSLVSTEFSSVASYPGDDAVYEAAYDACWADFAGYVGFPYEDSVLWMDAFTPTLEGWNEVDDRIVNCVVFEVNADASEIVMSSGSLRDAGR